MDGHGYVRIYDNGELYCDESLAELIKYTDSAKEFMDFCFDLWKKRTNQRIFPNCVILGNDDKRVREQVVQYRDSFPKDYFVE